MSDNLSLPVSIQRVKKETSLIRTFVFDRLVRVLPRAVCHGLDTGG